jgi:cell division protein ZapA
VSAEPTPVKVHILDKEYLIACQPEERDGLIASARRVDERMREIRKTGRVIGTDRIAVMAAINLAYEQLQTGGGSGLDASVVERLHALQGRIAAALAEPGTSPARGASGARDQALDETRERV